MLTEKLANDIANAALSKLQTKTAANWKRPAALAALGLGGAFLGAPAIAESARDAGTVAGSLTADGKIYGAENSNSLVDQYNQRILPLQTGSMLDGMRAVTPDRINVIKNTLTGSHLPTFDSMYNAVSDASSHVGANAVDALSALDADKEGIPGLPGLYGILESIGYGPVGAVDRSIDTFKNIY